MDKRKPRKGVRRFTVTYVLLALFVAALVVLIFAAPVVHKSGSFAPREETRAVLQDAKQERARHAAAVEQARKALPPGTTLPYGWNYRPLLKSFRGGQFDPLMNLVSSLVNDIGGISDASKVQIRAALADSHKVPADNPFYFPFSAEDLSSPELLLRLSRFLRQSKPLREFEEALKLGLLEDISTAYRNPLESELVDVAVLFAGRAVCEVAEGDTSRALDTLLAGYGIADLLADWTHIYGPCNRYYADRMLDKALWRLVDAAPVSGPDRERLLAALDARVPVDRLKKTLLTHAANLEIGEESDHRGYPDSIGLAFAFTGRGAMEAANGLVALLGTPPYQAREQLAVLSEHRIAGYWVNRFLDSAVEAYKMNARESLMGDIALLAFALKDWQQERGAYPPSLEALAPFPLEEIPREPLTGDPIAYETNGTSFRLTGSNDGTMWPEPYWTSNR